MSDLRKRFEKETGKKVEITSHFDCEDSDCDADVGVDIWNNEYIMWLENLANGKITEQNKALHLRGVVPSTLTCSRCGTIYEIMEGSHMGCCTMPAEHRTSNICGGALVLNT